MIRHVLARLALLRNARVALVAACASLIFFFEGAAAAANVVPPRRLDDAQVPYPAGAQGEATVTLRLVVDANGDVTQVTVQDGSPPFSDAAVDAVKRWRFTPATKDDAPVSSRIAATVTFHPPQRPAPVVPAPAPVPAVRPPAGGPTPARDEAPDEVSVKGDREELGTNHIPRSETRLVPGAFGDPFRVVEALPGMAPWLSGLPYYYVRGAPPETVGYSIDGIKVPLLFHVGAGPSSIAPPLVDSVDLLDGGYPAAFGRYAGAIIAGETTRPEDVDHVRGEAGARVFDAHAFVETPLPGDGATLLAGARYSYTGLLTSLIVPNYQVGYWDYQFRVSHRVAGRDMLSLFVFGSHDELSYKGSPTFHVEYHRADLRYDHPLPGGQLRIAGTFSYDDTLTALQTSTGAGATAALKGPGGRVRAELEERVSEQALVRAGADFGVERFDVDEYGVVEGDPSAGVVHAPHDDLEGGVHADVVWRPSAHVELVPGFRLDGYRTRGATAWAPQPRAAGRVQFAQGWTWISAFGVAHQEPTEEVFVPAKLPDPVVDESGGDAYQLSEAVEARLPSHIRVRATAFYSEIVARHIDERERSLGIELFARRDFTERLGGFVSYTLSKADDLSTAPTPVWIRAAGDRRHLLSVVLGYDLGNGWRIGGRFFFESGRGYQVECPTPTCAPQPPGTAPVAGYPVTGTLPPFYRLDARLEKKWTFPGGQWVTATLEGFNVLDKAEPTGKMYTPAFGLVLNEQSPIILPSIGIEAGL
jgi:TonB family protein